MSRRRRVLLGALAAGWAASVITFSIVVARLEQPDPLANCEVVALSGGGVAFCLRPR